MRVTFSTVASDGWLRQHPDADDRRELHSVIVQDAREAERIVYALARLKYLRGLPFGGAMVERE